MRKINEKSNIFGELIEKYRIEKNISRVNLAEQLKSLGINMDRTHIFRIEKGKVILKDFELIAICMILNINYAELETNLPKKI